MKADDVGKSVTMCGYGDKILGVITGFDSYDKSVRVQIGGISTFLYSKDKDYIPVIGECVIGYPRGVVCRANLYNNIESFHPNDIINQRGIVVSVDKETVDALLT